MPLHRAPTEFGKNSTLRISAGPKRPKFFLFNVPALPPKIVPGQVGVLPAQRRQVSQHAVVIQLAGFAQGLRRPFKVHGVPQHVGGGHQVQTAGAVALLLEAFGPLTPCRGGVPAAEPLGRDIGPTWFWPGRKSAGQGQV